jgi:transcriptional regulator with XRE-family HTH domain
MRRGEVGPLLRQRRRQTHRSQLDLANEVGVSPRHLSFVELGKSRPSPELLTLIATHLDVPLRDQNSWLLAAGYAPRFTQTALDDEALDGIRCSIQALLDGHEPYPAAAVDRNWTAQLWNRAALRLADGIPDEARGTPTNMFRVTLHPDGFARRTRNFDEWAAYMLRQLDLVVSRTRSPELVALADEIAGWPNIPPRDAWAHTTPYGDDPVIPWIVEHHGRDLSFFTVMATLGAPLDVTLAELTVEFFFPADDATASVLNRRRP